MPKRLMNKETIERRVAEAAARHEDAMKELIPESVLAAMEAKEIRAQQTDDGSLEVFLEGPIDAMFGVSASSLRDVIGEWRGPITLRINSIGGNVFEGKAIQSMLARHPAPVRGTVESVAASAAAFIGLSLSSLEMAEGSRLMTHSARGIIIGTAEELRAQAELLESIDEDYRELMRAKSGAARGKVAEWVSTEDTWFSPQEALDEGLIDGILPSTQTNARLADPVPEPVPEDDMPKAKANEEPAGGEPDDVPDFQAMRNKVRLLQLLDG